MSREHSAVVGNGAGKIGWGDERQSGFIGRGWGCIIGKGGRSYYAHLIPLVSKAIQ